MPNLCGRYNETHFVQQELEPLESIINLLSMVKPILVNPFEAQL